MKTIFYLQNQIIICNKVSIEWQPNYINPNPSDIQTIVQSFLHSKNYKVFLIGNMNQILNLIKTHFNFIVAAGGIVINQHQQILLIKRLGMWDLPKGKVEKGEKNKIAAIREVEEECGISEIKLIKKLEPSFHVYPVGLKYVLKKTYWYYMKYYHYQKLVPQLEEDITEAIWTDFNENNLAKYDCYPAITKVLHQSLFLLE